MTGGAGYLGSVLVPALLESGHAVTVIDNFMYKQNSLATLCTNKNFNVINADVRNTSTLKSLYTSHDVIIPLAALVGAPICSKNPVGATTINKDAVLKIFEVLSKNQIVLMPTTNSAYGTGDENNFCTEESPLRPISQYAIDKVNVETKLMMLPNAISFRLATVFGMAPRMRIDLLVNDFTYRAFNDRALVLFESHFKRNYIHVRDVARVFIHALKNIDIMRGNIYNVGLSSANLSKRELADRIKLQLPETVIVEQAIGRDPDQRNYIVSNEKIESTGFSPKYDIDSGIGELIKGYSMINNSVYSNI
ncbi:SDR family oxidoreductase [Prochlorococcus sp. MIT 1300]|uniref:NAD-dependent epimerase/dehydratase family protein n=1 Tax=Prochlorococcus sp. MIT 1300 TaxID=3096218 RepID=UPI002A752912|nr:SDR family oxidoreductase [Prochlorococcus sp. MIT 1300]